MHVLVGPIDPPGTNFGAQRDQLGAQDGQLGAQDGQLGAPDGQLGAPEAPWTVLGSVLGRPGALRDAPGAILGGFGVQFGVDLGSLRALSERRFIDYLASMLPAGRPRWLHLAALVALGRPGWLSKAKKRLAFRLSASMLPASCALERFLMPQI